MPVSHLETDTCSPSPCWGKEEHTEFAHVPLMIGTVVSPDPETPVLVDSSASCVMADGNGNMSSAQPDWYPGPSFGLIGNGPIPEILMERKFSAFFPSLKKKLSSPSSYHWHPHPGCCECHLPLAQ